MTRKRYCAEIGSSMEQNIENEEVVGEYEGREEMEARIRREQKWRHL